jgi:hypothetical protein
MKHLSGMFSLAVGLAHYAFTAPGSCDLWEHSQAGFSVISVSPATSCGAASNIFGTAIAEHTDFDLNACALENVNGVIVASPSVNPTVVN